MSLRGFCCSQPWWYLLLALRRYSRDRPGIWSRKVPQRWHEIHKHWKPRLASQKPYQNWLQSVDPYATNGRVAGYPLLPILTTGSHTVMVSASKWAAERLWKKPWHIAAEPFTMTWARLLPFSSVQTTTMKLLLLMYAWNRPVSAQTHSMRRHRSQHVCSKCH